MRLSFVALAARAAVAGCDIPRCDLAPGELEPIVGRVVSRAVTDVLVGCSMPSPPGAG